MTMRIQVKRMGNVKNVDDFISERNKDVEWDVLSKWLKTFEETEDDHDFWRLSNVQQWRRNSDPQHTRIWSFNGGHSNPLFHTP